MRKTQVIVTIDPVYYKHFDRWAKQSSRTKGQVLEQLILEQCPSVLEADPQGIG